MSFQCDYRSLVSLKNSVFIHSRVQSDQKIKKATSIVQKYEVSNGYIGPVSYIFKDCAH